MSGRGYGPARKPSALRLLQGARPSDVNQHEPIAVDILPVCPDDTPDDVAEIFRYAVGHLDHMGIASAADRDLLIAYCWAVVNHRTASKILAEKPALIYNDRGDLARNPAFALQKESALLMRQLASEFGLSPAARAGIETKGSGGGGDNPFGTDS